MTAAVDVGQVGGTRAEQLEHLRRKMAAVSGTAGRGHVPPPATADRLPATESLLPLPDVLARAYGGGLPRGTVAVVTGARSLALRTVAAVSAAGGQVAVVGHPDLGLLAAVEMGADLDRVALVPDPGIDPVEVAAVLTDGMDLVVLGLAGRRVPLARGRAVMARARSKGATLLVTDGDWEGAPLRVQARVCDYAITGVPGRGRIERVRLSVRARGRSFEGPRVGACG